MGTLMNLFNGTLGVCFMKLVQHTSHSSRQFPAPITRTPSLGNFSFFVVPSKCSCYSSVDIMMVDPEMEKGKKSLHRRPKTCSGRVDY